MPRVLKKTLQARARRLGIKGFSKMTYAQLEKAIATAKKKKPKRKTTAKRSTTRRKPMGARGSNRKQMGNLPDRLRQKGFKEYTGINLNQWAVDLKANLKEEIDDYMVNDYEEIEERINEEIYSLTMYREDCFNIIKDLDFTNWGDLAAEFGDPEGIEQLAYLALIDFTRDNGIAEIAEEYLLKRD